MQLIGGPMTIQNTDGGDWIVQFDNGVTSPAGERVSFIVHLKRDPFATVTDVERRAVERAIQHLQAWRAQLAG